MTTPLEDRIRTWIGDYVAGRIRLSALEDDLVRVSWELRPGSDPGAEKLINRVELLIAELTSGHRTELEALRAEIARLIAGNATLLDEKNAAVRRAARAELVSGRYCLGVDVTDGVETGVVIRKDGGTWTAVAEWRWPNSECDAASAIDRESARGRARAEVIIETASKTGRRE